MELVGRVQQASLAAGRSHFNRGTHGINVESPGVYAVQVCVRAWPTCRGRAAHYSNPCVAVCARCPLPPLRLYHFAAAKYNVHISKRGLVPVSPGLGQISTRNTSVKMCWNTSLPRRIANEDAHVARVPFFFFFFLILATFPSLLSRTSFVDARLRLQDPLIFQFFSSGMWNTSSIWISRIN